MFSHFLSPERSFWLWFIKHAKQIATIETGEEAILNELTQQLKKIHSDLAFEIGLLAGETREFIISANGIRRTFPSVEKLVAAAPAIDGWKITAFRPPKPKYFTIQLGDYELAPKDVWFNYAPDGNRIGLILYIQDLSQENERIATQAVFILLDNALGEYHVATRIGFIELKPLPDNPSTHGLLPFTTIKDVIGKFIQ